MLLLEVIVITKSTSCTSCHAAAIEEWHVKRNRIDYGRIIIHAVVVSRIQKHRHLKAHRTLSVAKRRKAPLVDRLTFISAVIEPAILLPQIYRIFKYHNAVAISISAWIGFEVFCLVWLWYGFVHKDRMIMTYQGLYFVANSMVIVGALMYGGKFL